ncbi:hypothetical protein BUALT_Bualt10G0003500 [Buddleja alternifolia]|uniref:Glutaredoxin domain-containing protein n=1 Tax=Buddleja alternifolia TaxID=168488 RepID=A0AAV6X5S9_9LAMI|nr:hypothetical protein BUALT_Bualt10G0003500 [Buddleja alternifolia]
MGCVSSTLLNPDEEFSQIGGSAAFSHHIVSLTSTTYGLLTLDPPPQPSPTTMVPPFQTPPPRSTLGSLFPSPLSEPRSLRYQPLETINSWDLMSGLDSDHIPSFRFSPLPFVPSKPSNSPAPVNDENVSPNVGISKDLSSFLNGFEMICPPNGEDKVVMYSTTLRGVRKTFDDCNCVRSAIQGLGIMVCERDISMDKGFRDELRELMKGKGGNELMIPPRLFVKGRYIGGVDEVMKIVEEGYIGELLQGLPKLRVGYVCEGCGGGGFLPCFTCHGSCKMVMEGKKSSNVVVRCSECNENGLVLCPIWVGHGLRSRDTPPPKSANALVAEEGTRSRTSTWSFEPRHHPLDGQVPSLCTSHSPQCTTHIPHRHQPSPYALSALVPRLNGLPTAAFLHVDSPLIAPDSHSARRDGKTSTLENKPTSLPSQIPKILLRLSLLTNPETFMHNGHTFSPKTIPSMEHHTGVSRFPQCDARNKVGSDTTCDDSAVRRPKRHARGSRTPETSLTPHLDQQA